MSSLLDKAMAALLNEDQAEADKLFHEFVIQRAKQVNESVSAGGEVDIDAIVEGKSFKRGKDDDDQDVADKKQKDKDRKDGSSKKRGNESLKESDSNKYEVKDSGNEKSKVYFSGTQAACENWIEDNGDKVQYKGAKFSVSEANQVDEGQLTATQGDDGTLTIVHDPVGAIPAPAPIAAPVPVADPLGGAMDPVGDDMGMGDDLGGDMDFDDEFSDDLGVSDDPLPGIDDLNDEAFESLSESLASELKEILVDTKEGETADGKKIGGETHSPVPNVGLEDRVDGAEPVETKKGGEHNGFDREPAPKVEAGMKADNVRKSAMDGQKTVTK